MNHPIGIIGGMGPLATQLFYKLITEHTRAEKDQDHVEMIILSDTSMPDRTEAILSGDTETVRRQLLSDAQMLEGLGCSAIGITCNTAHYFADMIRDELRIPLLHMLDMTVAEAREKLGMTGEKAPLVGIMATDGTIRTGLYQQRLRAAGLEPWCPDRDIQGEVMHQIYDCIKAGISCDKDSFSRIDRAFRDAGCDRVILGCTELSVIKEEERLPEYYIDPMLVLAKGVIEFSGRSYK